MSSGRKADVQHDGTLAGLRQWGWRVLADAGVPDPGLDSRVLLQWAAGVEQVDLIAHGERLVAPQAQMRFEEAIARRCRREPVSQITGMREFWSLPFAVSRDTLAPRPDTESLIEGALEWIDAHEGRDHAWRLLDFGTGTGCILLSLLHELPHATGVGVDMSARALEVAARNRAALELEGRARLVRGCWGQAIDGVFDLILSNPPYIPTRDLGKLDPEVERYEPHMALDGGMDGLDAYRDLIPDVARLLRPVGLL